MFDVSDFLLDHLRSRSRDLIHVFEVYRYSYEPFPEPSSGNLSFDPRHAVKRWAGQNISFDLDGDTVTYERQVLTVPSINKYIGKKFDDATIGLSNVDRSVARYVLESIAFGRTIEGTRLVIRVIPRSAPSGGGAASCYQHSIVLYVGRVNKPDNFTRSSGTLSATQDLGTTQAQIPPHQYQPACPLKFKGADCLGAETLDQKSATYKAAKVCNKSFAQCTEYGNTEFFQGLRIVQIESSFVHKSNQTLFQKFGFGLLTPLLIKRRQTVVSNSIHDGGAYGQVIPLVLGRWLMKLIPLQFQDIGTSINFKMAACRGKIHDFLNITNESIGFNAPHDITKHLGEYGGVGTQTADTVFPDASFHSKLAYITGQCDGSDIETEDPAPQISSLIVGQVVRAAFGTVNNGTAAVSSVFAGYTAGGVSYDTWCDNPVDLARFVITDAALLALPTSMVADRATVRTASYCIGPIKDLSNAERAIFPASESTRAGVDYKRYNSTGMIGGRSFRVGAAVPQQPLGTPNREADYEFDDGTLEDGSASLAVKTVYRKRYTAGIIIQEPKKAIDFLYDTLFPSGRLFLRWDALGRLAIDSERPTDHSYLRGDVAAGATTIAVHDVFPWKPLDIISGEPDPLRGKLLIGAHKLHSEVRSVSAAAYSADGDAITLDADATGGLTATPSGATFSGGSSSTPSSGTIVVGGTPSDGDTLTAIIDGFTITVTATNEDEITQIPDCLSMAEQLVYAINAEPVLQDYVEARGGVAGGSTADVGIYSKLGVLTIPALEEDHYAELDDPTVAPMLAASSGSLSAGAYLVSYAYRNANGNTNLSPIAAITLTASQQIDITAITPLPTGASSVDWFVSVEANSGTMLLVANNDGSAFSINALPESTDADPPKINTTGEEVLRVAMSFAGRALTYADTTRANVLDGTFTWPEGGRQSTVNQVKTKYREAIRDFGEQPLVVNDERHQEITGQVNSAEIDLSAVDNFNQASRLCNGYLAKLRDGDFFFKWGSAGEALLLEVGSDVVCLSDDSGEWRNVPVRVEDITYSADFKVSFSARLYSNSQFNDSVLQTEVPLPSALVNYKAGPPDIEFNTIDFPSDGLVQSTDGTAGITSIRGGAIFGASSYPQHAFARLIKRAGVTVNEQVGLLFPDSNLEAVFEFIASADGLYTVELEVCDASNICNATKPTASIVIGFGSLFGLAAEDGFLLLTESDEILEIEH